MIKTFGLLVCAIFLGGVVSAQTTTQQPEVDPSSSGRARSVGGKVIDTAGTAKDKTVDGAKATGKTVKSVSSGAADVAGDAKEKTVEGATVVGKGTKKVVAGAADKAGDGVEATKDLGRATSEKAGDAK